MNRIMAKSGVWKKLPEAVKSSTADQAIQRRFYNAVHTPLQAAYQPKGLDAAYSGSFQPVQYSQKLSYCWYTLFGERYFCEGDGLTLNKFDINSTLKVLFNYAPFVEIYDTTVSDNPLGYHVLREGFPVEIRPGIWQFNEVVFKKSSTEVYHTKMWLITYDAQLPWSYVTRREFLLKRKVFLQKQMAAVAPRLKEQLLRWEQMKKAKEQEWKSEPAKLANYMSGTHNPAIEREQSNFKKEMQGYERALARIDEQLSAPADELGKWAIVIKSTQNNFDYSFTDKIEPFAELLIKPNPAYFKKMSSPAVPQMINVILNSEPKDPRSATFATEIEKLLNFDYYKSFIGKTAPPSSTVSSSSQNQVGSTTNKVSAPASSGQSTSSSKTNKETTSKPLTPQGPLASNGMFLTGTLSAPAEVPVTLAYNNGNDLTITPAKANGNLYSTSPIRFSKSLKEEEAYNVTLKKIASNMKGVVYYGKGKAPNDVNQIKVGVDFTYELLTRSSEDKVMSSFYESFAPAVGGFQGEEGRYVVFVSATKDFAGSNGKFRQVFWRDRNTGVTKMISVSASGEQGNADCAEPSISADGQTVVFESKATNLVSGDNNNAKDIFLWRKSTNNIELISKATNGAAADAESFDASISGNGNFVVFTSPATNLATMPKGRSLANIFLRDIQNGKTEMISVDPVVKTGGNGYKGSISFDGSRISFCSPSGTLVANDKNNLWDIFLWQRGQPGLKRISMTHDGKEKNGGTESASRQVASSISGNGRYVAFATTASNMVPNDNNTFQDVFVVDVETGKVNVASFTDDGQPSNNDSPIEQGERVAISYDGTWVAFPTKATNLGAAASNIILHNTISGKKTAVSNVSGSYGGRPAISYSGSYVLFGKSVNLDNRFSDSGIFAHFTGNGPCRDCK
ncbi:hypothetical protein [Lacibacter sp. H407]|uniref:hypothetical protein n=1 Tax=Lacibacter sp. H407 TaxID=3133423 RepID=UPI0030C51DA9